MEDIAADNGKQYKRAPPSDADIAAGRAVRLTQQRFVRTRRAEIFTQQMSKLYRPYYAKGRVFREELLVGDQQRQQQGAEMDAAPAAAAAGGGAVRGNRRRQLQHRYRTRPYGWNEREWNNGDLVL